MDDGFITAQRALGMGVFRSGWNRNWALEMHLFDSRGQHSLWIHFPTPSVSLCSTLTVMLTHLKQRGEKQENGGFQTTASKLFIHRLTPVWTGNVSLMLDDTASVGTVLGSLFSLVLIEVNSFDIVYFLLSCLLQRRKLSERWNKMMKVQNVSDWVLLTHTHTHTARVRRKCCGFFSLLD